MMAKMMGEYTAHINILKWILKGKQKVNVVPLGHSKDYGLK
jgi:hypothetical protein